MSENERCELGSGLGAELRPDTCHFRVWAPNAKQLVLLVAGGESSGRDLPMLRDESGYFTLTLPRRNAHPQQANAVDAGDRYFYRVDGGKPLPDPVSRFQPLGVHGPSEIVDPGSFAWSDAGWRGLHFKDFIMYELHVGTFTPQGTFDAAIARLDHLASLGVNAIELMPVAAFPGERNWGYDGVGLFAVQDSYGGPHGLRRLVDAAHARGFAVLMDVVYNHLGNEGNYLREFGPYFTSAHTTPWGDAVNYDAPGHAGVRHFVTSNALNWLREYHIDGLRLDAVQTIRDDSEKHILREIQEKVRQLARASGREITLIAETDENDSKVIREYGFDGFWSDDFHHAWHALLTGECMGYYLDFGSLAQIARALQEGYIFQGEHFNFWKRPRGTPANDVPLPANIICLQNHDQVGNRAFGDRLSKLAPWGARRAAAAFLLLAPHTPLIFMGEEFDETRPFQFFTSFADAPLVEAVRRGRKEEFKQFGWNEIPDPQAETTFLESKLDWSKATQENDTLAWYRALIALRKKFISGGERRCVSRVESGNLLMEYPNLRVIAGQHLSSPADGWTRELFAEDAAWSVSVESRPLPVFTA